MTELVFTIKLHVPVATEITAAEIKQLKEGIQLTLESEGEIVESA